MIIMCKMAKLSIVWGLWRVTTPYVPAVHDAECAGLCAGGHLYALACLSSV